MHDFHCKCADDMHSNVLADRVRQLKETTEGVDAMCREMEQIKNWGIEKGRAEGRAEQARETALSLAGMGLAAEQIAQAVKVSVQLEQTAKKYTKKY